MTRFFDFFKKKEPERILKQIELSKIDKHMNLIMREKFASANKITADILAHVEEDKHLLVRSLHAFSKKNLMNPNIPRREIQIMEGNRDNYVRRITSFVSKIEPPRQYMDLYNYTIRFSTELDALSRETQKNMFILRQFFENELKDINRLMTSIEENIIKIRVLFEKNNVQRLSEIQSRIDKMKHNIAKVLSIQEQIAEHEATIKDYKGRVSKLSERIDTITAGTDFRTLESFKQDKEKAESEIKQIFSEFERRFSQIEFALRKYFYKNQDRKILREYFDDRYNALLNDTRLEIADAIDDMRLQLDSIDLKDKKREHIVESLSELDLDYIKQIQSDLKKLEEQRAHMQTKITHNSASLNLSEQQYWLKSNQEKIDGELDMIDKLNADIEKILNDNKALKTQIHEELERILGEEIELKDDLFKSITEQTL